MLGGGVFIPRFAYGYRRLSESNVGRVWIGQPCGSLAARRCFFRTSAGFIINYHSKIQNQTMILLNHDLVYLNHTLVFINHSLILINHGLV